MKPGLKKAIEFGSVSLITLGLLGGYLWKHRAERDQSGDWILDIGAGVKMRLIPVESLKLGVGKYEVTNKQFRRFMPSHQSGVHENTDDLNGDEQPVANVSWKEAKAFCEWLTQKYGTVNGSRYRYRLPTEEEWIAFATCGTGSTYPWGDAGHPPDTWNYYGTENSMPGPKLDQTDGFPVSCPVRKSGNNAWRLYGVGGNVWEWCEDACDGGRLCKGASWADYAPLFLQTERRSSHAPDNKSVNVGFRVVAEEAVAAVPAKKGASEPAAKEKSAETAAKTEE